MKGLIAVQRKMLKLIYVIDKNQKPFDGEYHEKRAFLNKLEDTLAG
jgi:hypothetical protein